MPTVRRKRISAEPKVKAKAKPREKTEEEEERELEEKCSKYCGRAVSLAILCYTMFGFLASVYEWSVRPPMIIENVSMDGKVAIITGASDGIGAAAAMLLAHAGAHLVLGCRDVAKGQVVADQIFRETGNADVEVRELDLASMDSVRAFAVEVWRDIPAIDLLLNNAGTAQACVETVDGMEHAMQVNYLSHFLLTKLLLPKLKTRKKSRVVHVTCGAAHEGKLTENMLAYDPEARCNPVTQYANSKLMTLAFSNQLQSRLEDFNAGVVSNAVDPGSVATSFKPPVAAGRTIGFGPQVLIARFLGYLLSPVKERLVNAFKRSEVTAAKALLHVGTSPHLARVGGKLFSDAASGFTEAAGCSRDSPELCGQATQPKMMGQFNELADLWDESVRLVKPWSRPLRHEDMAGGRTPVVRQAPVETEDDDFDEE